MRAHQARGVREYIRFVFTILRGTSGMSGGTDGGGDKEDESGDETTMEFHGVKSGKAGKGKMYAV